MSGTLYGVGVGPGDPELLTLKAARILREAPVVAYPAPLEGESMARGIAARHIPEGKTEIAIRLPFAPERGDTERRYDRAADDLCAHLEAGRDVAVLCLGDPLFYGTFARILPRVADRFPVEVVPGVTAMGAAAAALRLPAVLGGETLTVVPATLGEDELSERIGSADCAVVVKLGRHLEKLRRVVDTLGLMDSAHYAAFAATGDERVCKLADVGDAAGEYFALVMIRKEKR